MGDFDETQLASDWTAICGITGTVTGSGGEAVVSAGVTYWTVWNQVDATLTFAETNRKDDEFAMFFMPRAALKAGFAIDTEILRVFDSVSYRIVHREGDQAGWQHTVRKLYPRA